MSDKKTCLIVDDSSVIRQIAARIVADLGLETAEAENAVTAVELCREKSPAVVFLDWDLPSMGALDFLRSAAGLDDKPVIILCATENDQQQFTLAKAAGAEYHILKPYDQRCVEQKLAEIGLIVGQEKRDAANQ